MKIFTKNSYYGIGKCTHRVKLTAFQKCFVIINKPSKNPCLFSILPKM